MVQFSGRIRGLPGPSGAYPFTRTDSRLAFGSPVAGPARWFVDFEGSFDTEQATQGTVVTHREVFSSSDLGAGSPSRSSDAGWRTTPPRRWSASRNSSSGTPPPPPPPPPPTDRRLNGIARVALLTGSQSTPSTGHVTANCARTCAPDSLVPSRPSRTTRLEGPGLQRFDAAHPGQLLVAVPRSGHARATGARGPAVRGRRYRTRSR